MRAQHLDDVLAERVHDHRVGIVQDLRQRPSPVVLADDVRGKPLLLGRARAEERERVAEEVRKPAHGGRVIA